MNIIWLWGVNIKQNHIASSGQVYRVVARSVALKYIRWKADWYDDLKGEIVSTIHFDKHFVG